LDLRKPLVRVLRHASEFTAREYNGFLAIGCGDRMNLSEIQPRDVRAWRLRRGKPILHGNVPAVRLREAIPYQFDFDKSTKGKVGEIVGKANLFLRYASCTAQEEEAVFHA
jgi:hypothetical protein